MNLVDNFASGWSAHDPESFAAMFSPDAEYIDYPLGIVSHGRNEIRAYMTDWLASSGDVVMELTHRVVNGDAAAVEWAFRGTHTGELAGISPSGRTFTLHGASFLALEGETIASCSDYWDLDVLLRQLRG